MNNAQTEAKGWLKAFFSLILTGLMAGLASQTAHAETLEDSLNLDALALEASALDSDALSEQRGKADLEILLQSNDSDQNALLQDNSLVSHVTGNNSISDNAFSGVSGISTVIQNTGNQVIIQDTTLVNVMINQ